MFERCLYFNSNALVRQLNRMWDDAYAETGLSAPHAYLLRMVCHQPGLSQKEIAKQLYLDKSTVTRFVNSMIDKGYILKQSSQDGRENLLIPSKAGKKLGTKLDAIGNTLYAKLRKQFGNEIFSNLVGDIRTSLHNLG